MPILKFRLWNIDCDLCTSNEGASSKNRVLKILIEYFPLLRDFILLAKRFFKQNGLNNPNHGTVNSYAIALMCVFHCQQHILEPRLPPLKHVRRDTTIKD